jgi:hypothetical protein
MPADPTLPNAIRAGYATVQQIHDAPEWAWRATVAPGTFALFHNGEWAGELVLRSGLVTNRARLLDHVTDHLNHQENQ